MKSVKLFFFSAISLAFSAVLFNSCNNGGTTPVQYDATFYVGGVSDAAYIYKDGEILYNLGDASIHGIALADDGSVYASGLRYNNIEGGSGNEPLLNATIWKDGKPVDTDALPGQDTFFENIVVNGNKWASCAIATDEEGIPVSCLVENGKIVYTSESDVYFLRLDYGASGDYYIAADDAEGIKILRISAQTQTLVSSELVAPHAEGYTWIIKCLHVGNSDIAVGLDKNFSASSETDAYIWLNGGRGLQCVEPYSEINDITFFGGYLVAAGNSITVTGSKDDPTITTSAVQWVNFQHQDFSYGCTGSSSVTMVKNWNDVFLFQCVHSQSGLQLCHNGNPLKEVKTAEDFYVTCWDVSVNQVL